MFYLPILVGAAFVVFFYRSAELEDESSLIWSGLSIVIFVLTFFWLHWGWLGILLGQAGLFFGITAFRAFRKS